MNAKKAYESIDLAKLRMRVEATDEDSKSDFEEYYKARRYLDDLRYSFSGHDLLMMVEMGDLDKMYAVELKDILLTFGDVESFTRFLKDQGEISATESAAVASKIFSDFGLKVAD